MKKFLTMVMVICVVALLLIAGCATRAAQSPLETGSGNANIDQTIQEIIEQEKTAQPEEQETGEAEQLTHIHETIKHKSLPITLNVDADVDDPDVPMPVLKVQPGAFTQETVDRVCDALIGDAYFADYDNQSLDGPKLRSLIEVSLALTEKQKAFVAKQEAEQGTPLMVHDELTWEDQLQDDIDSYQETLKTAQPLEYFPEESRELHVDPATNEFVDTVPNIMGYTEKDGTPYRLWVRNDEPDFTGSFLYYERFPQGVYGEFEQTCDPRQTPGVDYEKALKIAQEMADKISGGQMAFASAQGMSFEACPENNYIQFHFTRTAEHAQANYDNRDMNWDLYNGIVHLEDADYSDYEEPWSYEKFNISVDNNGVQGIEWTQPVVAVETVTKDATVLPFDEIMGVFQNMFFVKNSLLEDQLNWYSEDEEGNITHSTNNLEVTITKIQLGLMRVQSGEGYMLVPVWDFYGYAEPFSEDGKYVYEEDTREEERLYQQQKSMLTINAMDGSIINRDVGY